MRRAAVSMLCAMCLISHARAQQVVIDPSQIAASATNAADQIDFMIDQLGELTYLGEQMQSVKGFMDDVFGNDGLGTKAISILNDLGTLDRLTRTYNDLLKASDSHIKRMRETQDFRMSDINAAMSYLRRMQDNAELSIELAKRILETAGFSKKEKKDEIENIITQMEQRVVKMERVVEIETEASKVAEGLTQFNEFLDDNSKTDHYVQALLKYGSKEDAARGSFGVVSIILAILCALSTVWATVQYIRGSYAGDPVTANVFMRVAVALFGGLLVLQILAQTFNLKI